MQRIYFRADASKQIGYGHFVRSLALAGMLKDSFECIFCTQTPTPYQSKQVAAVCELRALPADDSKFPVFLEMLSGDEIVVLDNFYFTVEYQQQIRDKGCKVVCMGGPDRSYVADLILSQATTDSSLFHSLPHTQYCLGLNWALLRKEFTSQTPKLPVKKAPKTAVVCYGGTDFHNLTGKTVNIVSKAGLLEHIDIIVGDVYDGHIDESYSSKVTLHRNLSAQQIVDLFHANDVAILSASSITIEAMACGIPVIAGWYVDNQDAFYHLLVEHSYIYGIGNLLTEQFDTNLLSALQKYFQFEYQSPFDDVHQIPSRFVQVFKSL